MSFVRKRSDGKHELVKSVRTPGKKNPAHKVIMHLGDFATVQAAHDFNVAESKAGCRKGEGHLKARIRRMTAGDAVKVLARHLPKPKRVVLPLSDAEIQSRAWASRQLALSKQPKRIAVQLKPMQDQFAKIDTEAGERERESIERDIAKMWGLLKWRTFEEALEALQNAGAMARDIKERSAHYKRHMPSVKR
jgi:hypothetical protein